MRPTVTYFSDVLCVWAYVSQVRLDQLAAEYGDRILIEERFCSVFPDARTKTAAAWNDKGGYDAMNQNFQKLTKKFPHISVHEDVWTKVQPRTSSSVHMFLKAIQLLDGDAAPTVLNSTKAIRQFRTAFFAQARDISDWHVQGEIAEEIVDEQNQFAIYTNLSRKLQGTTFLAEQPKRPGDRYRRHGLTWMTALARVELGAMLAGFTSNPRPFHAVKPSLFDGEEYREILLDGLRMHYWSLKRDPAIQAYFKTGVPENHIITYGRRASVARHFLQAVHDYWASDLLRIQLAELSAEDRELKKLQLVFLYCLSQKSASWGRTKTLTSELSACPPLLAAARRELGNIDEKQSERTISAPRLSDLLRQVEPTLIALPCR